MAFDAFIKISDIPRESTDVNHKDWIEITSFSHGLTQPISSTVSSAGGASAERVDFGTLNISKLVDKASPKLFEAGCTGKHIKEVVLEFCRSGGDKQKFLEIRMEQVLIANYNVGGKESPEENNFPSEHVSFAPGKYKMVYTQQQRADGTPGGNVTGGWDLIANKTFA